MTMINQLIIEGEVIEKYIKSILLVHTRNNECYHFEVECGKWNVCVGDKIRVVGRLEQDFNTENIFIVAEHIEVLP